MVPVCITAKKLQPYKKPINGFENIINIYFGIKGEEIIKDFEICIERGKFINPSYTGVARQNENCCNKLTKENFEKYLLTLLEEFKTLLEKLNK